METNAIVQKAITDQSISQLKQIAINLNWENAEETKLQLLKALEDFQNVQKFMGGTPTVTVMPTSSTQPYIPEQPELLEHETQEINKEEMSEQDLLQLPYHYRFHREPRGGRIIGLQIAGNDYRIGEELVLKLGLSHGDIVHKTINSNPNHSTPYKISLVRTVNKTNPNRLELIRCKVEEQIGKLFVDNSEGRSLRNFQLPEGTLIYLHDKDIIDYQISSGDLIDVAIEKNRPEIGFVLRNHKGGN